MEVDTLADASSRLAELEQALQQAQTQESKTAALEDLVTAFPLLYGYWIKLVAESPAPADTWRRALKQCPTIELWSAYLKSDDGTSLEAAEAAIEAMGQHFQAEPVWDAFLARAQDTTERLKELLRIPLYAYSKYFQLVYEKQLESADVLAELSQETAAGVTSRWEFESQLTRFYFHTVPVDANELRIWDSYLDFEESEGDDARINMLYTRCLTVTALYAGFWLRWIRWLGMSGDHTAIDAVFSRAFHYHPYHTELRLLHVRTLEARGDFDECRRKIIELNDAAELVAFDLRHGRVDCTSQDYAIELAKQTGDLSHLSEETKKSNAMFDIPAVEPKTLFDLWRRGLCPDSRAYAQRLKASGALAEFFAVDSTLGYGD